MNEHYDFLDQSDFDFVIMGGIRWFIRRLGLGSVFLEIPFLLLGRDRQAF